MERMMDREEPRKQFVEIAARPTHDSAEKPMSLLDNGKAVEMDRVLRDRMLSTEDSMATTTVNKVGRNSPNEEHHCPHCVKKMSFKQH